MRDFSDVKRIVIKIGTSTISTARGLNTEFMRQLASQIHKLLQDDKQVVIVTSGAIGMGAAQLGMNERVTGIRMRQACAAIGQPLLMQEYRKVFLKHKIITAQVLLTADVLSNRKTYLNLRNALESLLELGTVPILNENDSVSTEEIGSAFGDNDRLSAFVASKIDADALIMLSDIDALYDKDPRQFRDAEPIPIVAEITGKIEKAAGSHGSTHARGGMKTKIQAARITSQAGCRMILASGNHKNVITEILQGKDIGTVFLSKRRLGQRVRWIINSTPAGTIRIDHGALRAIRNNKSLLPSGIQKVEGEFKRDAVVMINDVAKAVAAFSSAELRLVAGKHSGEIEKILGAGRGKVVAIPENIIFLDD
ncbi:MAG: glutamate 5-kinase [Spirochaetales bacterium]|nr:glutamate 5-kinase [Spirochaetales bacterium]